MSEAYGGDFITMVDENGEEFELEICDTMEYNGKTYMLFLPADMDENDPDYGYVILRQTEDEGGETVYDSIDDEDELQEVYDRFMALLFDEEEEDE